MSSQFLPRSLSLAAALAFVAAPPIARALDATEWSTRQPLVVETPGLVKLALPPETLGAARPGLEDLRLLDPAGREVPYTFATPRAPKAAATVAVRAFRASLDPAATLLELETGTTAPLEAITLATPATRFLKAARVELATESGNWETVADRAVVFRQFGAEQLRLELGRRVAARLRVTVDDSRTGPVPFTGATLQLAGSREPEVTTPIAVRIVRRDAFAGESVLTLDLGGAHVPLAELGFETDAPLFARTVTVATRELRDESAAERTLGTGSIWRVAVEGAAADAKLVVSTGFTAPSRELLVHIDDGDSPPLAITGVTARQRPHWLVFRAAETGTYTLLTGHPQVPAPRYDLAPLGDALRDAAASAPVPGAPTRNPGYQPPDTLAEAPLAGAAIDPAPWSYRKSVRLTAGGVQEVELDLDVLSGAQPAFADLRLVRDGAQIPYLLERTRLWRTATLGLQPANDPKRPGISRWQLTVGKPGLPLGKLTLVSTTPVFQRHLRLFEVVRDEQRGEPYARVLAESDWSHKPGDARPLTLPLAGPPAASTLFLETDNGDNPPIVLLSVEATYPVVRLLFKTEALPAELYYGNGAARAPRYDLALMAPQILAAEKSVAALGPEQALRKSRGAATLLGGRTGLLFWAVLALVVGGLLVVVAKLLPKPPVAPPKPGP